MSNKLLLGSKEAAAYLGVSIETLAKWRTRGLGARYLKTGEGKSCKVFYPRAELDKFVNNELQKTA